LRLFRYNTWRRLGLGIILILSLVVCPATFLQAASTTSNYEALRLLTEAFYEITQKFVSPKKEGDMLQGALRGMMNSLDPDSSFLTAREFVEYRKGSQGPMAEAGMELVFKDHLLTVVSVLDGGAADRTGLKPGDHILKINGKLIRNITTQEGVRRFQGSPGKTMKVQVLRNGLIKPLDLSLTLEPLSPPQVTFKMLKGGYAYVRLPYFSDELPKKLGQTLGRLGRRTPPVKGLILDLRNNARGNLEQAVHTASLFLGDGVVVSTRGRQIAPEEFHRGSKRDKIVTKPLPTVILMDKGTARGAEILAGALRHHSQGLLLGEKTFGLCGLTKVMPLQDGSALVMTVAYCYTPGGRKITGSGLKPDIEGKKPPPGKQITSPTPKPENDPWVRQAVEVLKSGKPSSLAKKAASS